MELKQLESFVAVIKYGSFTKAAQVLYMSQPSISTHIRTLEKHLDTPLINRSALPLAAVNSTIRLRPC